MRLNTIGLSKREIEAIARRKQRSEKCQIHKRFFDVDCLDCAKDLLEIKRKELRQNEHDDMCFA